MFIVFFMYREIKYRIVFNFYCQYNVNIDFLFYLTIISFGNFFNQMFHLVILFSLALKQFYYGKVYLNFYMLLNSRVEII